MKHPAKLLATPEGLDQLWQAMLAERRRREENQAEETARRLELRKYHDDPVRFVQDCLLWRPGEAPTAYQLAGLQALVTHGRHSMRAPRAAGKSALAAWVILWFVLTRDAAGEDWKVATTASVWRQLRDYLWREIPKWAAKVNWLRLGRPAFGEALQKLAIDLPSGRAFAVASDNPATVEGAHADQMLLVFDEAKIIPDATWDSFEGTFAGSGAGFALAISTPGPPVGRFYDIQTRKPGYEDWHVQHVTVDDMVKAGRQNPDYVEQRRRQWGEKSSLFQNHILGEFAADETEGIIPLSWVEAAQERWHIWREQHLAAGSPPVALTTLGLDLARTGEDKTVLALRSDMIITEFRRPQDQRDTMEPTGMCAALLQLHPKIPAVVDADGLGGPVVDRLRELGFRVRAYVAQAKAMVGEYEATDRTGELRFVDLRAASWWWLRELLHPDYRYDIALPPEPDLMAELTIPQYRMTSGGRIRLEPKDEIRKRLQRSTDYADAVVMAFAEKFGEPESERVRLWGGPPMDQGDEE